MRLERGLLVTCESRPWPFAVASCVIAFLGWNLLAILLAIGYWQLAMVLLAIGHFCIWQLAFGIWHNVVCGLPRRRRQKAAGCGCKRSAMALALSTTRAQLSVAHTTHAVATLLQLIVRLSATTKAKAHRAPPTRAPINSRDAVQHRDCRDHVQADPRWRAALAGFALSREECL